MKKKGIALILALALALTLIGVAVATDPTSNLTMDISAGGAVDDGSSFTVTVTNKAATFNALTFYVEFPTEDLTVKNVTWKLNGEDCCGEPVVGDTVVAGGCSSKDEANASGKVGFYYLDVAESGDGKTYDAGAFVAVITFQVNKVHSSASSAAISLREDSDGGSGLIAVLNNWLNNNKSEIPFSGVALKYVLGDVNNDENIDADDVTALLRHVAGIENLPDDDLIAGDVDKNDSVDADDVTKLLRYVSQIDLSLE